MRINKTDYYMGIARAVSMRSTCARRQYGAVIVKNDEIIATGYNGSPRGAFNCSDNNICYRMVNNVPHGEQYEKCEAVHAEQNAMISASRDQMIDSVMYLAGYEDGREIVAVPCNICRRMIINAGIAKVINKKEGLANALDS